MTKVYIADDHAVVRVGLRNILAELGGFEVIGEAENGRQVLRDPLLGSADVLVLDLSLPVVAGTEVLRRVREQWPSLAVVVHSMHPEAPFAARSLAMGAAAYVPKDAAPELLIRAVRGAAGGARPEAPRPPAPTASHDLLTPREYEVFQLVLQGRQVVDIAAELDVHSCTVSNHLAGIRRKLGVKTVAEMVRYGYAAGLIPGLPGDG